MNIALCMRVLQLYVSAVFAIAECLSVRLSQPGVLSKQLNMSSRKQRRMVGQGLWFESYTSDLLLVHVLRDIRSYFHTTRRRYASFWCKPSACEQ